MQREFNMSYKQDIIDGKVKVVTDCGEMVEIVKWDCKGSHPILAVINDGDTSDTCFYDEEGLSPSKKDRIYVLTDEPESEDERIRKKLISFFSELPNQDTFRGIPPSKIIAWLEKQGVQGNADKVEPKFNVGDWVVVDGVTQQVTQIRPEGFDTDRAWNGKLTFKDVPLWTIQDAKDGDVLADSLGNICIYQEPSTKLMYHSYCYGNHKYFVDSGGSHVIVGTYPATKEQRDLLFQKIKEAGYEWDAEKKELKKIKQNFVWSDEDEATFTVIGSLILDNFSAEDASKTLTWLHSLRPNHWKPSDEQMKGIECAIKTLKYQLNAGDKRLNSLYSDLKKLKEK